ncbi:MAG: CysS/YqeB C-terminal domain-containing protein, partial [Minisyncoccales bacterium]
CFQFIFEKEKGKKIPKIILELVKKREDYRREKNWQKADLMRKEIKKMGWWIEDTKEGPIIKKIK